MDSTQRFFEEPFSEATWLLKVKDLRVDRQPGMPLHASIDADENYRGVLTSISSHVEVIRRTDSWRTVMSKSVYRVRKAGHWAISMFVPLSFLD
jgi:hypothetical protein